MASPWLLAMGIRWPTLAYKQGSDDGSDIVDAITASQALRKNLKAFVNGEESEYVRISSRHYQQAVEQLKKKDAGLDLTEALRSILTGRL